MKGNLLQSLQKRLEIKHHQKRLKEVKGSNYGKTGALKTKKKKQQVPLRAEEIQRENEILIAKIASIHNPNKRSLSSQRPAYRKSSLLLEKRKQEFKSITGENKVLLERLRNLQPVLDSSKMFNEARKQEERFKNICRQPIVIHKTSPKRNFKRTASAGSNREQSQLRGLIFKKLCEINDEQFVVSIEENREFMFITCENSEHRYEAKVDLEFAREKMNGKYNFDQISNCLAIQDENLVFS